MRLLFKPVALLLGVVASRLAGVLFDRLWKRIDDAPPQDPDVRDASGGKAIAATALRAGVFAGTRAAVDRYGMHAFEHATGAWPGKKTADPDDDTAGDDEQAARSARISRRKSRKARKAAK